MATSETGADGPERRGRGTVDSVGSALGRSAPAVIPAVSSRSGGPPTRSNAELQRRTTLTRAIAFTVAVKIARSSNEFLSVPDPGLGKATRAPAFIASKVDATSPGSTVAETT